MRIIGGSARGRRIKSPPGRVRPTADRVREALFSILGADVPGSRFLDLFAGSGAVGFEALSRGADFVAFVEEDTGRAAAISKHLREFAWSDQARVFRLTARKFLTRTEERFDIIFVDPPYGGPLLTEAFRQILLGKILSEDGILVLEHPSSTDVKELVLPSYSCRPYRYGDTMLSVYRPLSRGKKEDARETEA